MSKLSKISVSKMPVHSVTSMVKGMKKTTMPRVKSMMGGSMMGGDLIPKPKGLGPADIGLVPSKRRKY